MQFIDEDKDAAAFGSELATKLHQTLLGAFGRGGVAFELDAGREAQRPHAATGKMRLAVAAAIAVVFYLLKNALKHAFGNDGGRCHGESLLPHAIGKLPK